MLFIICIFYRLMCVFMIFYYIIQSGRSFLHSCALNGHTDICIFLIFKGVNINELDVVSTVFHYSCVTTDNIYRIYPFWQRCKTCYPLEHSCHIYMKFDPYAFRRVFLAIRSTPNSCNLCQGQTHENGQKR